MRAIGRFLFLFVLSITLVSCDGSSGKSKDKIAPVITLIGSNPQMIEAGSDYVELGATSTDNRDGDLSNAIVIDASQVNTSVPGNYTVTYKVSDAAGNAAATVTRTVVCEDTTQPVITLTGEDIQVIVAGNPYIELGATASDTLDGDLSAQVVVDATAVDTMVAGDYTVTYDVTDAAGNAAVTVTRTVRVELPPLPAAPQVSVEGNIKQLIFSWDDIADAEHYRLMENPDGHSGFTQVGADISAGTLSVTRNIAVHMHDWANALYMVEACNLGGCAGSTEASATNVMLDTIGYFKASNTEEADRFGYSVALSNDGRTMVVGAPREDGDDRVPGSGAVYVFRFDGTAWSQQAYIKASNPGDSHYFGYAVDISGDGMTLAIGAPWENSLQQPEDPVAQGAGAVYIFLLENSAWTEQVMLKPAYYGSGPQFGTTVSLSADGNRVAIGAPLDDVCATGVNGELKPGICVDSGAAYVFDFDGSLWSQQAYIKGGKTWDDVHFGAGVFLSDGGGMLAVDAPGELRLVAAPYNIGSGYTFRFNGSDWIADTVFAPAGGNLFFHLTGMSGDGATVSALLGKEVSAGLPPTWNYTLQVFRRDALEWVEEIAHQRVGPLGYTSFYSNAALSADGNVIVAGIRDDSNAIGIDGDRQNNLAVRSGAVDVFRFDGLTWEQGSYVKAVNTEAKDWFGGSIALSADGNTLAVGATHEDSGATGINGDQTDNSAEDSGAVYVY